MYKNSKIDNVQVKNSNITVNNSIQVAYQYFQFFAGGIAGNAQNTSSSLTDPGSGSRYSITNCYAEVDIDISKVTYASSDRRGFLSHVQAGGIIGNIYSQPVWPENCLYSGSINSNSFIGPIFGGAVDSSNEISNAYNLSSNGSNNDQSKLIKQWNGTQISNSPTNMTSDYTTFVANSNTFTATVVSGTSSSCIGTTVGRRDLSGIQGVNKGTHSSYATDFLTTLNTNDTDVDWITSGTDVTLKNRLTATVTEGESGHVTASVTDNYSVGTYTYKWYNNGVLDSSTTNQFVGTSNWDSDQKVQLLVSDGTYTYVYTFTVKRYYIAIEFTVNSSTNSVTAKLVGTGIHYVNLSDYTFKWYKTDIAESEQEIPGETTLTLNNLEQFYDYKLVATNSVNDKANAENSFTYGDRIVIFVDYNDGDNSNDGFTPDTAVKDFSTAYGKLNSSYTMQGNVIVLMGTYSNGYDIFYNTKDTTNSTYKRNVTITGKYQGTDYDAELYLYYYNNGSSYNFINGDTTFQYLTFYGGGSGQAYLYAQGHSLTMGNGITMSGYSTANTNQGLITSGNAPAFHVFGGYLQYNKTTLPRNNSTITIKSGAYARVLGGGGSGTSSGAGQSTSHDFTGSNLSTDTFTCTINIDIGTSTKGSCTYDVDLVGGGATAGNMYANETINIISGSVGRVLGGSIGDKTYISWWNYPENTYIGSSTVNISGGSVQELYGGSLGRNMAAIGNSTYDRACYMDCDTYYYGTINVNISGGTVNSNIYGAGAGGVTGYNENSSDEYKSYGQGINSSVNINISGGTINGNIYGGGYGYTNYLTEDVTTDDGGALYGDSNITISGGRVNGNVYGAGCGYNYSDKTEVAQMIGNTTITTSGSPTITGKIYGGGAGIEDKTDMAKLTGNTVINIGTNLGTNSQVFGGGNYAITTGTTTLNITDGTQTADIYGGGNLAEVGVSSTINIDGENVSSTAIFGGGKSATVPITYINMKKGKVTTIYGSGNEAGSTTTNITMTDGTVGTIYGGSNKSGTVTTTNVTINGGKITDSAFGGACGENASVTTSNISAYGGEINNIFGGGDKAKTGTTNDDGTTTGGTNVYINSATGTITNVFGGGNKAEVTTSNVKIDKGTITTIYGGGNEAGATTTTVTVNNGNITTLYGGSNTSGTVPNTYVTIKGGTITSAYGGACGENASVGTSTITTTGGTITNLFGGGEKAPTTTRALVEIMGGTIENAYGGGNQAGVTQTIIGAVSGNVTNMFGGSNQSGIVKTAMALTADNELINLDVTLSSPENNQYTYGTDTPYGYDVTVTVKNLTSNVVPTWDASFSIENSRLFSNYTGTTVNYDSESSAYSFNQENSWYSAGSQLSANGSYSFTFKIASSSGDLTKADILSYSGTDTDGNSKFSDATITNVYGGNNAGGTTEIAYTYITGGKVTNVYGGGKGTGAITGTGSTTDAAATTTITKNATILGNTFGGGDASKTDGYVVVTVESGKKDETSDSEEESNMLRGTTTGELYGGGNAAEVTGNVTVNLNGSKAIGEVYGGGNEGKVSGNVTLNIIGAQTQNYVYGGGNLAKVSGNITITMNKATASKNVYAGGNNGIVIKDTTVKCTDSTLQESLYGGGNGRAAIVYGNTNVYVDGTTTVTKNIFGGGNKAANGKAATTESSSGTGSSDGADTNSTNTSGSESGSEDTNTTDGSSDSSTSDENTEGEITTIVDEEVSALEANKSTSTVNIVGATIGGNVYGGANTSVVNGTTKVNIGLDAVATSDEDKANYTIGDIAITGTVFGGGEANESGSETYDFSFISVTQGVNIEIDGTGYEDALKTFTISGSIFGSGNASSSSGASYINIKNYGDADAAKANISIQRATELTLDNSAISLIGTTDRTNDYASEKYSLSRVTTVTLKNNSILFMCNGANVLGNLRSVVDVTDEDGNVTEEKSYATIDSSTHNVTRNVDNRIYMLEGKNLNISYDQSANSNYGEVYGMIFFGIFTNKNNPATSTGMYYKGYNNGDTITNLGTFSSRSYVKGKHKDNHDITVDGFYTNYNIDDCGIVTVDYVDTTPKDDVYYLWYVGKALDVTEFDISLQGSKYATMGTKELQLIGFSDPNIKMTITGFSSGLENGISLVEQDEIDTIASTESEANSKFGLTMKTGKTGWQSKGQSNFLTANGGSHSGTNDYAADNSSYTPTFIFYMYHSENITLEQELGDVRVRLLVQKPKDELNYDISFIDIVVTMSTKLFQDDYYEAAMTPGQEFELFSSTNTTITSNSALSAYYSLYVPAFSTTDYYSAYSTAQRLLISRKSDDTPYYFPKDTKITMLDMVTNKYYYYIVTEADVNNHKYMYNANDFIAMGSTTEHYNGTEAESYYYNTSQNLIYENFIFQVNFADVENMSDVTNNSLLMELQDSDGETLVGVLGVQRDEMKYTVYSGKDATIKISTDNLGTIYLGDTVNLNVTTNFEQKIQESVTVYDTQYFDDKLGLKISVYDKDGNKLNIDSLLGISFELDGTQYYPRVDGTTRIKLADKVTDVLSKLKMHTENNTVLATGDYLIQLESFGSPDGVYYGNAVSDKLSVPIRIINSSFGLKVWSTDEMKIINKDTGNTENGTHDYSASVEYTSNLASPLITVTLERRDYLDVYEYTYNKVDLKDYVSEELTISSFTNEYIYLAEPVKDTTTTANYTFKEDLKTGTYRLTFTLYDDGEEIGKSYEYIIIK